VRADDDLRFLEQLDLIGERHPLENHWFKAVGQKLLHKVRFINNATHRSVLS